MPWSTAAREAGASRQGERPPLWIVLPAVLVALFELLPLLYLVARTLDAGENGWQHAASGSGRSRSCSTPRLLAGAVAVSTIVIAVPLAWLTSRTDLPGRAFWSAAAALPLVIPSYIGAVVDGRRVWTTRHAAIGAGAVRGGAAALDLRVYRVVADADALHLSLRLSHRARGIAAPRSIAGRGGPLSRLRSLADLFRGHPAADSSRGGGRGGA